MFSKQGLMDKKEKWSFEREDERKTTNENRIGRKTVLKTGVLGKK